ncbi:Protein CBR-LRON-7 [Caenorhabditis briggsae]|uniref:Protein CBR-LRON-7 n=1 Tax=Caenorhabditis briggsae TaxID=6238 RepID=A8XC15_CAEBR|nr:Protein CBR-LRON-7 [Caenorhabditis briggsae]CAP30254.2 Protein CBR-LRON-7 [Caenorhabditis briggsae]
MRIQLLFLLLILVICAYTYDPVKVNYKEKGLANKDKPLKVVLTKDEEYDEDVPTVSIRDLEKKVKKTKKVVEEDEEEEDEEEEEEEEPAPKKKPSKKKSKKVDPKKEAQKKKKIPVTDLPAPDSTAVPNMTSFDILELTRELRIQKLRDIISNPPVSMIETMRKACNFETSGDNELCHCDMEEMNCNSRFDLSFNQIRYMDSDVFKPFTNLSNLDLSHNNLQSIKKAVFDNIKDTLHRLDIGYNRIKSLPDGVFEGLSNLKTLFLDGNPIKEWKKEMFKGLDNLEKLSMDNCKLESLPADLFEHLPKLNTLSLRENPFDEIPSAVANKKSLKNVDMSATNLTEIRDHAFAGDSDLEEINLERMPYLSAVRDCGFCELSKLKFLMLNDNQKLIELHPNAFGFIKSDPGHKAAALTTLYLDNSNLNFISEHMIDYDNLQLFKIGNNPWKCDCDTQFLLEEKFSFKQDSVAPKCASPAALQDKFLATVRASDACDRARFLGRSGRFSSVLGLALLAGFLAIGGYYMVSSGKLEKLVRRVRKEPEVTYTNLQNGGEDIGLETDFQPRPAEV